MKNLVLFLCVISGWSMSAQKSTAMMGTFILKYGETLTLADKIITFEDVKNDSRCPKGVTCVWAGEVQLVLWTQDGKNKGERKTYAIRPGATTELWRDGKTSYRIVKVLPYPQTNAKIPKEAYSIVIEMLTYE